MVLGSGGWGNRWGDSGGSGCVCSDDGGGGWMALVVVEEVVEVGKIVVG